VNESKRKIERGEGGLSSGEGKIEGDGERQKIAKDLAASKKREGV
jgi:hypothetical protein